MESKCRYEVLRVRKMRKGIVDHAAVKFLLESKRFNIAADHMDRAARIFEGSDSCHLRRDIDSGYAFYVAMQIIRKKHTGSTGNVKHGAACRDSTVVKNRVDHRFVSYHSGIPGGCTAIKKCNDVLFVHKLCLKLRIALRNQVRFH